MTCEPKLQVFAHPLTAILSKLHPSDDLLVNEVWRHIVFSRVVPGGEDLLSEEESPGSIPLLGALLLGVLLTLGYSVHDVVTTAAERRHLTKAQLQIYSTKSTRRLFSWWFAHTNCIKTINSDSIQTNIAQCGPNILATMMCVTEICLVIPYQTRQCTVRSQSGP